MLYDGIVFKFAYKYDNNLESSIKPATPLPFESQPYDRLVAKPNAS